MPSTLIDTNVIIDVIEDRPVWVDWSIKQMAALSLEGSLLINPIVYGEASAPYEVQSEFDAKLDPRWLKREDLPWDAAFEAGKAHFTYRKTGGRRNSIMPDFLIGAHALVKGYRLLTRDAAIIRQYFPHVEIIAPDTHS